jgi:hypothetical protein
MKQPTLFVFLLFIAGCSCFVETRTNAKLGSWTGIFLPIEYIWENTWVIDRLRYNISIKNELTCNTFGILVARAEYMRLCQDSCFGEFRRKDPYVFNRVDIFCLEGTTCIANYTIEATYYEQFPNSAEASHGLRKGPSLLIFSMYALLLALTKNK